MSSENKTLEAIYLLLEPRDEMSTEVLRGIADAIFMMVEKEREKTNV